MKILAHVKQDRVSSGIPPATQQSLLYFSGIDLSRLLTVARPSNSYKENRPLARELKWQPYITKFLEMD